MSFITKKTWEKNDAEVIIFNERKWINETHIEKQLGHSALTIITLQYPSKLRKQRQELQDCNKQPSKRFLREDIAIQIIMDCRTVHAINFITRLRFNQQDPIMAQEQSILTKIKSVFSVESIIFQHHGLGYRIDTYFPKYKLAMEVDKLGNNTRDIECEIERQKATEKELNCKFIRINPAKEKFNIFIEIGKIQNFILKSTKKNTIDDIPGKLLNLEIKSNNDIKPKCLKYIAKKYCLYYKNLCFNKKRCQGLSYTLCI